MSALARRSVYQAWRLKTNTSSFEVRRRKFFSTICERRRRRWDIRRIIKSNALTIAFQPIVNLATGHLLGAEALSRFPSVGTERTPEQWFVAATQVGLGPVLEMHAMNQALYAASGLPDGAFVAVNLAPASLMRPTVIDRLLHAQVQPSRIVVEITEHDRVSDYDLLIQSLAPLRQSGVRLAVDDAGSGFASFRHIIRLAPEFIKLDRSIISHIDSKRTHRALASAVATLALDMGATLIAEGIERPPELVTLQRLTIPAGQGYLLGVPTTNATTWAQWSQGLASSDW